MFSALWGGLDGARLRLGEVCGHLYFAYQIFQRLVLKFNIFAVIWTVHSEIHPFLESCRGLAHQHVLAWYYADSFVEHAPEAVQHLSSGICKHTASFGTQIKHVSCLIWRPMLPKIAFESIFRVRFCHHLCEWLLSFFRGLLHDRNTADPVGEVGLAETTLWFEWFPLRLLEWEIAISECTCFIAQFGKNEKVNALKFAPLWNEIIMNLRLEDYISNK